MAEKTYKALPTLAKFHASDAFVRAVEGPFGSGKSVGMCAEIMSRAMRQEPNEFGIRKSVWGVVRNTMKQLEDTTIQTFMQWFPDGKVGTYKAAKHNYLIGTDSKGNTNMIKCAPTAEFPGGTWLDLTIRFRALDRPDQAKDLLSQEFTGIWFNEFREIPIEIFESASGRVGRGLPTNWSGVIMDSNPFLAGSAWADLFSQGPSEELQALCKKNNVEAPLFELYSQPGGLDDDAENLENLEGGALYYIKMVAAAEKRGEAQAWIDRHVHAKRVFVSEGKGIFTKDFNERIHVPPNKLEPVKGIPMGIGMDFGVAPSAIFGQMLPSGQWRIYGELEVDGGGAEGFAHDIRDFMRQKGWDLEPFIIGDPAGRQRSQTDAKTPIDVMKAKGYHIRPCKYQTVQIRLDSVRSTMRRMVQGEPGILIDRSCYKLIQGFAGAYEYRRMKTSEERYSEDPNKNTFSHLQDACQYLICEYEGAALKGGRIARFPNEGEITGVETRMAKPNYANTGWSAMDYKKKNRRR